MKLPSDTNVEYHENISEKFSYKVKYKIDYRVKIKAQGKTYSTYKNCCIKFTEQKYSFKGIRRNFTVNGVHYGIDLDWDHNSQMLQPNLNVYDSSFNQKQRELVGAEIACLGEFVQRNKAKKDSSIGSTSKINIFIDKYDNPIVTKFKNNLYASNDFLECIIEENVDLKKLLSEKPTTIPLDQSAYFSSIILKKIDEGKFTDENGIIKYNEEIRRDIVTKQKEFQKWLVNSKVGTNISELNECLGKLKLNLNKSEIVINNGESNDQNLKQAEWLNCQSKQEDKERQENLVYAIARGNKHQFNKLSHFCRIPVTCHSRVDNSKVSLTASCGRKHCDQIKETRKGEGNLSFNQISKDCLNQSGYYSRKTKTSNKSNPFSQVKRSTCKYDKSRTTYLAELSTKDSAFCEVEACVYKKDLPKQTRIAICPYTHWNPKKPNAPSGCEQYARNGAGCLNNNGVIISKDGYQETFLEKKAKPPQVRSQ